MITKQKLQKTMEIFPDEFTIDEILDKLILLDKIERADRQSKEGNVISEEELDKEIEKWFK